MPIWIRRILSYDRDLPYAQCRQSGQRECVNCNRHSALGAVHKLPPCIEFTIHTMFVDDPESSGHETWPQLFAALQSHLAPIDIVRLCTSSKAISHFLLGILKSSNTFLARQLLLQAVQQAATCSRSSTATPWQIRRHNRTVKWLVHTANISPELLQLEAAEYVNVPNVPLAVCKQLVASGVEVSYEQLRSAARNHVEGVENWITASKLVGRPARVTRLVEAVCCRGWQHIKVCQASSVAVTYHLQQCRLGSPPVCGRGISDTCMLQDLTAHSVRALASGPRT